MLPTLAMVETKPIPVCLKWQHTSCDQYATDLTVQSQDLVLPDDSGVQLSGVQIDGGERRRCERFTKTGQCGPDSLHVCEG